MQCGEEGCHCTAHTVAQQIHLVRIGMLADNLHDVLHRMADVITQPQRTVVVCGFAPIDQEHVKAALQQSPHNTAVVLQVEDVGGG